MRNAPTTALSPMQASQLAVLLDALDGVAISDAERASLTWLAGFEAHTVEHLAAVITRAGGRASGPSSCHGARNGAAGGDHSGWAIRCPAADR